MLFWSDDATLRIWNEKAGEQFVVLEGHSVAVTDAVRPPGGKVASRFSSRAAEEEEWPRRDEVELLVWEVERGALHRVQAGQTTYSSRLINNRSFPLFLLTTVATVVNPCVR